MNKLIQGFKSQWTMNFLIHYISEMTINTENIRILSTYRYHVEHILTYTELTWPLLFITQGDHLLTLKLVFLLKLPTVRSIQNRTLEMELNTDGWWPLPQLLW